MDERVGGQHHGGEERCGQQRATHLFHDHDELDVTKALAAVLFGNDEALQAELLGHLAPDRFVVALLGSHLLTHGLLGGLVLKERANKFA